MSNYSDKLKDPRWQKKRLEILERDDWACQCCEDTKNTLHVHHLLYEKDKDSLWETDSCCLITLCEKCHEEEKCYRKETEIILLALFKILGYTWLDIRKLSSALSFHVKDIKYKNKLYNFVKK